LFIKNDPEALEAVMVRMNAAREFMAAGAAVVRKEV
jgi:hypothetical protein